MSDNTATALAASLDGLEGLTHWIRFVTDHKAIGLRIEELVALTKRAIEAQAAAERAEGKLAGAKAAHDAECAERQAEAEAAVALSAGRIAEAERKEARLLKIAKDVAEHDERLRLEIMRFSNLMPHFDSKLQGLPSWDALAAEVFDKPVAPDDGGSAADDDLERVPVENLVAGSTISRSVSRTMRRG